MTVFYFTATGNSLYAAKRIGGELRSIPRMMKEGKHEFEDDVIGFVFPCYGFGMPRIVREFVRTSKFKAGYFFAVMTYGNIAASGLRHIERVGREVGIRFDYTGEILMVDNYLPMFRMEEQVKKEASKKIEEKLTQILHDIGERKSRRIKKGIPSDFISGIMRHVIRYDNVDKSFEVNDACNGCGVCKKVCPVNNIKVGRKPEFMHACECCYACIHHCPQNAIHLRSERSGERFRNQHISLKEIIEANNEG